MKRRVNNQLRNQLSQAGAKPSELTELVAIASGLETLSGESVIKSHSWYRLVSVGASLLVAVILGMAIVSVAQSSLPGSWLYPVKKTSENIAIDVHPSYRGVVMMQRAQEVEKLVANHASTGLVKATLADYQKQAGAYKHSAANYSAYEFCKANLQQAASQASPSEKQAINQTLNSLSDV